MALVMASVDPANPHSVARTLSARYYKDGAEILVDRGWDRPLGEKHFDDPLNQQRRPRSVDAARMRPADGL